MKLLNCNFLLLCFCILSLASCKANLPEKNNSKLQSTINDTAKEPAEEQKESSNENTPKPAETISPSRRLKAYWSFIDPDSKDSFDYRLNIEDTEQRKVIFSRKMSVPFHELAEPEIKNKLIKIEKLSNTLLLISQPEKYDAEGDPVKYKYLLISPDTNEIEELNCNKDFANGYEVKDFNEKEKSELRREGFQI